jgi:hypothetical protein
VQRSLYQAALDRLSDAPACPRKQALRQCRSRLAAQALRARAFGEMPQRARHVALDNLAVLVPVAVALLVLGLVVRLAVHAQEQRPHPRAQL